MPDSPKTVLDPTDSITVQMDINSAGADSLPAVSVDPPATKAVDGARVAGVVIMRAALDTARHYIGVREKPPGSNRGGIITEANLLAVGADGGPWCMAFAYWCYQKACHALRTANPLLRTGSVARQVKYAKDKLNRTELVSGKYVAPTDVPPGALMCVGRAGNKLVPGRIAPAHVGLVDALPKTIEGNSGDAVKPGKREKIDYFIITGE